ncbi:MAG: hypothetical protein K0R25_1390 [Rickettsiaceae bacterium]|jgi:antitoxin CptB|nr:hypothetical protein [Rickettsiaceae bacterium]
MDKEILIKSLLYKSLHRGCKETDILLGKFAESNIRKFGDEDLTIYSDLVLEDDVMIYDWILQISQAPKKYQNLINNIRQFHNL